MLSVPRTTATGKHCSPPHRLIFVHAQALPARLHHTCSRNKYRRSTRTSATRCTSPARSVQGEQQAERTRAKRAVCPKGLHQQSYSYVEDTYSLILFHRLIWGSLHWWDISTVRDALTLCNTQLTTCPRSLAHCNSAGSG